MPGVAPVPPRPRAALPHFPWNAKCRIPEFRIPKARRPASECFRKARNANMAVTLPQARRCRLRRSDDDVAVNGNCPYRFRQVQRRHERVPPAVRQTRTGPARPPLMMTGCCQGNPDVDKTQEELRVPGAEARARLRLSRGSACRRVPEEVLADPLFGDVEDRADLVEGGAEFSELVRGAFAADPRSLAGEGGAGFVQCLVPFGGRTSCLCGGGRGVGWCFVVVVEPAAPCGGDAPGDGGPAASFTLAACSFDVAGLLVPAQGVVVGGQESAASAWLGQEAGQGGGG